MIEPHELKNKQFSKVMRGYSQIEVDEHMEFVIDEYTKLYRENDELSRKLAEAEARLEAYRKDEESIRSALMSAQRASARIINDANDRADELLRATKLDCEKVLAEFRVEVGEERKKLIALKKAITDYKAGVYSKYMKHIEYLEQISPDYDLGELDLSEEEIAASDEGYVRRVLEDVKADLAEASAKREAENERRMADSRNGVAAALDQVDSAQPSDPEYYSDAGNDTAAVEVYDAAEPDAGEPPIPAAPEMYGDPAVYPEQTETAEGSGAAAEVPVYSEPEPDAPLPAADYGPEPEAFSDADIAPADNAYQDESADIANIDFSAIDDEPVPEAGEETDAPEAGDRKSGKKAKKSDRNTVRAAIEELNRKFRGQNTDADREYEEALKKLEETEDKENK